MKAVILFFVLICAGVVAAQDYDPPVCGDYPRDGASCNLPSVWWHRFVNGVCEEDMAVRKVPSQNWSLGRCPVEAQSEGATTAAAQGDSHESTDSRADEINVLLTHAQMYIRDLFVAE